MYLIFQFSRLELNRLRSFNWAGALFMGKKFTKENPHSEFTFILVVVNFTWWFLCPHCLSSPTDCWLKIPFAAITILHFKTENHSTRLWTPCDCAVSWIENHNQSNRYKNQPTHISHRLTDSQFYGQSRNCTRIFTINIH